MTNESSISLAFDYKPPKINCPKHGVHGYIIHSSIPGYEGDWCQLCSLEALGPSLDLVTDDND